MRRCLILYGLTLGVTLVLALREAMLLVQGNELVLPLLLGVALLVLAAGFWAGTRWVQAASPGVSAVVTGLVVSGLLAPVTLLYLRGLPLLLNSPPQPLTNTHTLTVVVPAIALGLAPACAVAGAFLALAVGIRQRAADHPARAFAFVFACAAAGVFVAGVLLNWVLLDSLNALQVALGVAALCGLTAFVVWWHDETRTLPWGWFLAPVFVTLTIAAATRLSDVTDFLSLTLRHRTGLLRASWETPYGRTEVVAQDAPTVYLNGRRVAGGRIDREDEEAVLVALLAHPAPRRLLVLGAFPTPAVRTALSLPWLRIDCAPLDPSLSDARDYVDPADRRACASPRVWIEEDADPRVLLLRSPGKYDVIFLNLPLTADGVIARLTSGQFLSQTRAALAPAGVLVAAMPCLGVPLDAQPYTLTAGLSRSLARAFPTTAMMPATRRVFFFASPDKRAGFPDLYNWPARARAWSLKPAWFTDNNIRAMATPQRFAALRDKLRAVPASAANTPLHPATHSATLAAWVAAVPSLAWTAHLDIWQVGLALLVAAALCALLLTALVKPRRFGIPLAAVILGLSIGAITAALLMASQCLNGTLYGQMGMIAGSLLLGVAFGAHLTSRPAFEAGPGPVLAVLQVALGVAAAALALVLPWVSIGNAFIAQALAEAGIPILALGVGFLAGTQLSLTNLLAGPAPDGAPVCGPSVPLICALAGGAAGMWLGGSWVQPALGAQPVLLGASLLSLLAAPLLLLTLRAPVKPTITSPTPPSQEPPTEPVAPPPVAAQTRPAPGEPPAQSAHLPEPAPPPGAAGGTLEGGPKDGPNTLRSS